MAMCMVDNLMWKQGAGAIASVCGECDLGLLYEKSAS